MTSTLRSVLFGSLSLVVAALVASCSSADSGQTLTVDLWPGENSVLIEQTPGTPGTPLSQSMVIASRVTYRGSKTLVYLWTMPSFPPTTGWSITPDTSNPAQAAVTFTGEGVYELRLEVFEKNGSISATSSMTITLDDPTTVGTPRIISANG